MPVDTEIRLAEGDHVVQFYAHDDELVDVVASYLSAAVLAGDAVIVIATAEHRAAFQAAMTAAGVEPDPAAGRLVVLDAAETLARFMTDDVPEPGAFDAVVGGLVRDAAGGGPVRAYGEMVALLWDAGNVAGAIELERLWNGLGEQVPFSLFCGYPSHMVAGERAADAFAEVCQLHSRLVRAAPMPEDCEVTRRFAGTPESARLARRFLAETLQEWERGDLADDGMLVVSELVTNAVMHARSDFTVGLSRTSAGVGLVIGDASPEPPALRTPDPSFIGGRGLGVVDAIAYSWGHQVVHAGKFVWVELQTG